MNFDFLEDDADQGRPICLYEPTEYRDAGICDTDGRRIGYEIIRAFRDDPHDRTPHVRYVAVTKNGEVVQNNDGSRHSTREKAEAWVERRIARSTDRYLRIAATAKWAPERKPNRVRAKARSGFGWRFVLVVLAIIVASPFFAGMALVIFR